MQLQNIFTEIEKKDPEFYNKIDSRRKVMKDFAKFSGRLSLASLPLALGAMLNKAYSKDTSVNTVVDVLTFALKLEYLESRFYLNGLAASGLIPNDAFGSLGAFQQISTHEAAHVTFLKQTITALGSTPIAEPAFDFTAKGTFPNPFLPANYAVFLAISQTFEDTGVRAYKGQAPNLIGTANRPYLTAALRIHSVEARHASRVRKLRHDINGATVSGNVKPWITLAQSGIDTGSGTANAAVQQSYAGEDLTTQAGVNIVGIGGNSFITAAAASESFDEPLTMAQVITIVTPFFA
ncbi:MAG: ferritin-like domain-containing protein [Chitinophagaceae bacterium]|nr:ferritin-like domain-containing protein [Chitinophagaceae bacterium]HEV8083078.1 ferritin-like domain-containing protein [Chitinophagaceae bacterium]